MQNRSILLLSAALALAVGCSEHSAAPPDPAPAAAASAPAPAASRAAASRPQDQWLGRWSGPEGTFLDISRDGDGYALAIQDLDRLTRYAGRATGDHLEFEREGKTESVRATAGAETGMKWLLDKRDCLTIVTGEGFCRD